MKTCPKCGAEPESYEVRAWGGQTVHTFEGPCRCPIPACFACFKPLNDEGRCQTLFCYMDGLLVPLPVYLARAVSHRIIRGEASTYG